MLYETRWILDLPKILIVWILQFASLWTHPFFGSGEQDYGIHPLPCNHASSTQHICGVWLLNCFAFPEWDAPTCFWKWLMTFCSMRPRGLELSSTSVSLIWTSVSNLQSKLAKSCGVVFHQGMFYLVVKPSFIRLLHMRWLKNWPRSRNKWAIVHYPVFCIQMYY